MDIKARLEAGQSKTSTTAIVNFIGNDKKRFNQLLDLFLKGDYRMTQRAAWPLSEAAIAHPELISRHIELLIKKLQEPGQHPAIARNVLRIFQELDLPEACHGGLTDICFKFITSEAQPVAIRAFAITVAANICKHYAELANELLLVLNDLSQYPQQPAVTSRIKSALKILKPGHSKH